MCTAPCGWRRALGELGMGCMHARFAKQVRPVGPMLQRYRVSAAARAALSSCSLFTPFLRVVSPAPQVSIGAGPGRALAWGCDLTYDYVKINADYTCALYPSRVSAPFTETPRPHFGGQPCWAVN